MWTVSLPGVFNVGVSTVEVADRYMDGRIMAVPPWIILHCCGTAGSGRSSALSNLKHLSRSLEKALFSLSLYQQ